jgi:Mg-chelatase subunit ChlD
MDRGDPEAAPVIRAAIITAALASIVAASTGAQQPAYRVRTDVVAIDVAVKDGRRTVGQLTARDFELRDKGVVQTILDFERERQPIDVTLTLDVSGSMWAAKLAAVQRAVAQVSRALEPADRVEIVTFTTHVGLIAPLAAPPIDATITSTGGGTSVLDAVLLSLVKAPVAGRRQLNILMTDADDSASEFQPRIVRETARFSSAQMSVVITRRGSFSVKGQLDETLGVLRAVAETTGGEVVTIQSDESLSETFLAALEDFRTSYVLRYTPTGVTLPGWHDVTVSVKNRSYTGRARRGYWGLGPG